MPGEINFSYQTIRELIMRILNLKQAAVLLNLSYECLRSLAVNNKIPAAKIGKHWRFVETDLVEYLRSHYSSPCKVSQGDYSVRRKKQCHSIKEIISGGSVSVTTASAYNKALARPTK